jgi:rare lipoprotein A
VVVRVNDRFANHKRRLIDVSRGAARRIGLIGPGTGRVRLEVVETPAGDSSALSNKR